MTSYEGINEAIPGFQSIGNGFQGFNLLFLTYFYLKRIFNVALFVFWSACSLMC